MSEPECARPDPDLFLTPPYCKVIGNQEDELTEIRSSDNDGSLSKIEVSNPGKLLNLIEDLTDKGTKKLEAKLNKYVSIDFLNLNL